MCDKQNAFLSLLGKLQSGFLEWFLVIALRNISSLLEPNEQLSSSSIRIPKKKEREKSENIDKKHLKSVTCRFFLQYINNILILIVLQIVKHSKNHFLSILFFFTFEDIVHIKLMELFIRKIDTQLLKGIRLETLKSEDI